MSDESADYLCDCCTMLRRPDQFVDSEPMRICKLCHGSNKMLEGLRKELEEAKEESKTTLAFFMRAEQQLAAMLPKGAKT